MPTNRKYRGHRVQALTPIEHEHLAIGSDHLLAGDCRLCRGGMRRSDWEQGREAVMADWEQHGFPYSPLAACVFDGVKLPPLDPSWRSVHRATWASIRAELEALNADD